MKTYDKKKVKVGDKVWVIGSTGVHEAKVLPPVTNYEYFGPVEVAHSFSTRKEAEKFKKSKY